jgi:1-deoxy-D-xylulose-5-phosphate synthase
LVHGIKTSLKRFFLGDLFFEQFGFAYKGPVDGHNPAALSSALAVAKESSVPVLIHVVTKKGFGFRPAEAHPTQWHGVGAFDIAKSENSLYPEKPGGGAREAVDYSAAFGKALMKLAEDDDRVVALTAAMTDGTGLKNFSKAFPSRFFDVGIAEEHLMGFAAGLAAAGLKPVVAIYSTFLQRSVDQVIHDIAIMNLPVVICVDRAGVVGKDGVTHQGLFDIALLRAIPNLTILQPKDYEDLSKMLSEAIASDGPVAIRYPRGMGQVYQEVYENKDALLQIWAAGDQIEKANAVARELGGGVVYARSIKPIDSELLASQRDRGCKIVSLENASVIGGLGDAVSADVKIGYPDEFIEHGTVEELEKKYSMDVESVIERLRKNG